MHIILCSDNPAMREAVQQSFAERADRLTVCESGMELLAAVKALLPKYDAGNWSYYCRDIPGTANKKNLDTVGYHGLVIGRTTP